jgi:hypothetical protein
MARNYFNEAVADLEKQSRENPWSTGAWKPGVWDECRKIKEIIREFEKK